MDTRKRQAKGAESYLSEAGVVIEHADVMNGHTQYRSQMKTPRTLGTAPRR